MIDSTPTDGYLLAISFNTYKLSILLLLVEN